MIAAVLLRVAAVEAVPYMRFDADRYGPMSSMRYEVRAEYHGFCLAICFV